jgi:NAD(P)-dependent dehydrogenase (short-subunit alcohol dehydrogenase family)
MGRLDGKRIIVTGGAGGIGNAAIRTLVEQGARVACTFNEVQPELPEAVLSRPCDVTRKRQVDECFDAFSEAMGGLDVLIHAAGVHGRCPAAELDEETWDGIFALNCKATLFTNQAAFRHLRERGGSIINMGSCEGVRGFAGNAAYASTRGAVMSWTRSIALEWGGHAIRANCVAPVVETRLVHRGLDAMGEAEREVMAAGLRAAIPLGGKMGDPLRDLAPVLAFLASDDSRFITGQTLAVDGGFMMLGS